MKKGLLFIISIIMATVLAACDTVPAPEVPPEAAPVATEGRSEEAPAPEKTGGVSEAVIVDGVYIPAFSFMVEDSEITDADMSGIPVYSVETTSTNTYGTTTTRVYVGYAISDILAAAGVKDTFSTLVTLADDGYTVSVSKEVAMEPTTLAAISEDEKLFKTGLWFAPCVSDVSPDYLRDLAIISLEN